MPKKKEDEAHVQVHTAYGHFCQSRKNASFLPILERTFWWAWRENIWALSIFFLHLSPTKHSPKMFY